VGYLIYRIAGKRHPQRIRGILKAPLALLILALAASLLPDLDAVPGVLSGDFSRFHNNGTHSLVTGLAVSLAAALVFAWRWRTGFSVPFSVVLLSYEMHVIMDFFTRGRGVMLLWPFSSQRFISPVTLFAGVRWSEGLYSIHHLWTLAGELVFVLIITLLLYLWDKRTAWAKYSP
jgi:inner membrane protein